MNNINSIRKDWRLIESLINSHSRILDIGCGEGELIKQLEIFPSTIQIAAANHNPGHIANYLYDLVKCFNSFYQSEPILKSALIDKKSFRVDLCRSVGYTIKNALGLLGIGVADRM